MPKQKQSKPTNVANVVPSLKKAKRPGKNAAQRQLDAEWIAMMAKHSTPLEKGATAKGKRRYLNPIQTVPALTVPPGREGKKIPSRATPGGSTAAKDVPTYTGTKILGIGQMHKSNGIPLFSPEEIIHVSKMRR